MEQISLGGINSVRGYRENQLVRDQGYVVSLDYRRPLPFGRESGQHWELRLFADTAGGEYQGGEGRDHLSSAGLGLHWQWKRFDASLSWAYRFDEVPEPSERDWQDEGINFQVRAALF